MNIEDECCCGEPDYGVFGDANQCPACRARPLERDPKREVDAERQRRKDEARQRVSREFNSYMIHLYNDGRRRT